METKATLWGPSWLSHFQSFMSSKNKSKPGQARITSLENLLKEFIGLWHESAVPPYNLLIAIAYCRSSL